MPPRKNSLRIEWGGVPAQWMNCCPLHPARECAYQAEREAYFCGRCGALYLADGRLLERASVTTVPCPMPGSALAWAAEKL
jgi:hypothetical protein